MMVFWNAGLVMMAVPKTGTQAYEATLSDLADIVIRHPPGLKHANVQKFRKRLRPLMDPDKSHRLQTLAVIREPLDWLGSWYRYRSRPQLDGHIHSTAGLSFDAFVEAYLQDERPPFAAVGSQFHFVTNPAGKVIADMLFPYEDQSRLRAFLEDKLKRKVTPPTRNVSPMAPLDLSPEIETRFRRQHADDFRLHDAVSSGFFLPL